MFSLITGPGSCGKSLYALRQAALSGIPCAYLALDAAKAVAQRLAALQAVNVSHIDAELFDLADPRDAVRLECRCVVDQIELLIIDIDASVGVGHPREPVGALHMLLGLVQRLHGLGIDVTLVQRGDPAHCHPDLIAALTSITTITANHNITEQVATVTCDGQVDYYAIRGPTLVPINEPAPQRRYRQPYPKAHKRKPPQNASCAAVGAST